MDIEKCKKQKQQQNKTKKKQTNKAVSSLFTCCFSVCDVIFFMLDLVHTVCRLRAWCRNLGTMQHYFKLQSRILFNIR
jgi:hypothetical protein